ncbi:nuclear transport factor 2 family protein [Tunturiibacter empetritectus]|uniref:DUF4440 domain-containing protein n=1 Tax=Tunturiibacter lichenicola TaxID=2051959 RepID=A0A852VF63_9BACT|nr:nuclear transport factor 2 family protein [Edaphobacter lichenicola]NYF91473.1 hypothetical protein [Edaphobacter lichenicola]
MTAETVLQTNNLVFYQALLDQDWSSLAELYADDYRLVRSNGSVLSKEQVLTDLQSGDLVFRSIKLTNALVRLIGSVALLTGDSQTIAERGGVEFVSHFRLVAVYVEDEGKMRLLHSLSTDIPEAHNA